MGADSEAAPGGNLQRVRRLEGASRALAVVLVALGGAVLFGWLVHVPALISLTPRFAPMKPNTALGFLCTGAALWSLQAPAVSARRIGRKLSWGVLLLGVLTLVEYVSGWDPGFDRLFYGSSDLGRWPARMSIS